MTKFHSENLKLPNGLLQLWMRLLADKFLLIGGKSKKLWKGRAFLYFLKWHSFPPVTLNQMNKKCPGCHLINFSDAEKCRRCGFNLRNISPWQKPVLPAKKSIFSVILRRTIICVVVLAAAIFGFYISLILTSKPLTYAEKIQIRQAIQVLQEKGFADEVFFLNYFTSFRGNDHWLNASVTKENAYAATNYPFEIMTIYPDFFTYPADETEKAAILLHEAKHLQGKDEKEAYEFVWKNRQRLGWTKERYSDSVIWQNVRKQTREFVPHLFVCSVNHYHDCTEN